MLYPCMTCHHVQACVVEKRKNRDELDRARVKLGQYNVAAEICRDTGHMAQYQDCPR